MQGRRDSHTQTQINTHHPPPTYTDLKRDTQGETERERERERERESKREGERTWFMGWYFGNPYTFQCASMGITHPSVPNPLENYMWTLIN
jgi:hypothetical protein